MAAGEAIAAGGAPEVSIVLAVLNERPNLPEVFARLVAAAVPSWEVVVVDDGSTDGTREFVRSRAAGDPRFRLLEHDGRQTTVAAQAMGIAASRGSVVVVMDADLQHPPELIPGLVRAIDGGATLAIASRYAPGGTPGPRSLGRILLSRGAEWTAKLALRPARSVTDPVSGFFAFRRAAYRPLSPDQRGYKLLLFLLVMTEGSRPAEVPFRFEPRTEGRSKVTSATGFVRLFLREVRLARRLRRELRAGARPAPRGPA
jgi:dolichol-phosphate mannosyltransferase